LDSYALPTVASKYSSRARSRGLAVVEAQHAAEPLPASDDPAIVIDGILSLDETTAESLMEPLAVIQAAVTLPRKPSRAELSIAGIRFMDGQ
jgi:hypothetical protein